MTLEKLELKLLMIKRFQIIKETKGVKSSYGTCLTYEEENAFVTEHPLSEDLETCYYLRVSGRDYRFSSCVERFVTAQGIAVDSISPYLYEIKFEEPPEG